MAPPKVFFGAFAMVSANVLRLAAQLAVLPVLARLLGPGAYGLIGLAMPFILFANMLSDAGMGVALTREPSPSRRLESTVFWLSIAIACGLALGLCAAASPLASAFGEPRLAPVLMALAPILVLSGALAAPNARVARRQEFTLFAIGDVAGTLLSAAAAVVAALQGLGAWSLVVQQLVLWFVKAAWLFSVTRFRPALTCDLRSAKPHLLFGLNLIGANIGDFAARNAPVLIIGAALGAVEVGRFTMATQLARLPETILLGPVYLSIFTTVAQVQARAAPAAPLVARTLRTGLLALLPLFAGLAVTADLVAALLLGPAWRGTGAVIAGLSLGMFSSSVCILVIAILQGLGRPDLQLRLSILSAIAVAAGAALGVQISLPGAALGVGLGLAAVTPLYLLSACRESGLGLRALLSDAAGPLGATLLMAMVVLLLRQGLGGAPGWAQLGAAVGAVGASYVLAVFGLFRERAWNDLAAVLPFAASRRAAQDQPHG